MYRHASLLDECLIPLRPLKADPSVLHSRRACEAHSMRQLRYSWFFSAVFSLLIFGVKWLSLAEKKGEAATAIKCANR